MVKKFVTLDEVGRELAKIPGMVEAIAEERAALQAAQFVKQSRKAAGLSQTQLARKLGVSQSRVSQIETGTGPQGPTIDILDRIATACGGSLRLTFERRGG